MAVVRFMYSARFALHSCQPALALPTVPSGPKAGNLDQKTSAIFEETGFHIFKVGPEWLKRRFFLQKVLTQIFAGQHILAMFCT